MCIGRALSSLGLLLELPKSLFKDLGFHHVEIAAIQLMHVIYLPMFQIPRTPICH